MSKKVVFKEGLRIGKKELDLLQTLGADNLAAVASALSQGLPAVLTAENGSMGTSFAATVSGTDVDIAPGTALLTNGTLLELPATATVSIPVVAGSQPIVVKAASTPFGPGTFAIGAVDRVTLTFTPADAEFNAEDYYAANDYVRLSDTGVSLGTFRIQTVTGNTVVLAEAVPGSLAIPVIDHAPAGKFFPGYPLPGETTDLVLYDAPDVRVETPGYTAASDEIIVATAVRSGGTVTVTDTRVPFRARGITNIVNDMVATNAAIEETKIALSPELLKSKTLSAYFGLTGQNELYTTQPDFFVTREGERRRVAVASDVVTPAFRGLTLSPASVAIPVGGTRAVTASVNAQPGATVTYTFTSLTTSTATVSQGVPGSANATITAVAQGTALILVRASAPAFGSNAAALETAFVTVSVSAYNPILTGLSVTPTVININRLSSPVAITATADAAVGASPTTTYTWSYADGSDQIVQLSSLSGASVDVTPLQAGTAQVLVTASAPEDGAFSAVSLEPVRVSLNVTQGLALLAEPGFRISFQRIADTTHSVFRWGISGTVAFSGLNGTMTIDSEDEDVAIAADQLIGQAFYDSAGRRYMISDNASPSAGTMTFSVIKISSSDANPANGAGIIRSFATSYRVQVFNAAGTVQYGYTATVDTPSQVWYPMTFSAAEDGTNYKFRLTAMNDSLSPAQWANEIATAWGQSPIGPVDIPSSNWISSTPTAGGVTFRWALLTDNVTNPFVQETMDYYVQTKIGDLPWGPWRRVDDDAAGITELRVDVSAPPSTQVQMRVKITDLSGTFTANNPTSGYDGEASAVTLSNVQGGSDVEYVYPFTLDSNTAWTDIGQPGSPRFVVELARYDGVVTSFTTEVAVSRIDVEFDQGNPLSQGAGTALVKGLVYPSGAPAYQIAGDLLTQGGADSVRTTDIDAVVNVNRNGDIIVALEYAASGDPNTQDPTGVGRVRVWFRGSPGLAI